MLNPKDRELYIRALQPPSGYDLQRAIATTYTLNLLTLLSVPLAFARFDLKTKDKILEEPISILEAVRRIAGKFHVFCQNGGIKVPNYSNALFQYLEDMVIEVSAPHPEGIFHPKIWILRFKEQNGNKVLYRFLCLSRNITFDKSWDTILTLEGEIRRRFFARNNPLSDFIKALPKLAKKSLRKSLKDEIAGIAEEIRHVDFKAPQGFEKLAFWPIGISQYMQFPIHNNYWRILVVSPFLTDGLLRRLIHKKKQNILISRNEELDLLKPETLAMFKEKYVMDEVAGNQEETSIEISSEAAQESRLDAESELSGLHAKLFVADAGWDSYLWTGSANATTAAFGNNVEFLVELKGKRSRVGIDKLLDKKEKEKKEMTTFFDLLQEYIPPDKPVRENELEKEMERELEQIQRKIANSNLRAEIAKAKQKNQYHLDLKWPSGLKFREAGEMKCSVWPISLKSDYGIKQDLSKPLSSLRFLNLSVEKITSLVAFKLELGKLSKSFVLNLPIRGVPEDRADRILQSIVSNRENFLRYLWFLLYEGGYAFFSTNLESELKGMFRPGRYWMGGEEMPLFEELVRTYSRSPDKIKRIAEVIDNISKTDEGDKILPQEFKELWTVFKKAKLG
jgi:hypothetical protein